MADRISCVVSDSTHVGAARRAALQLAASAGFDDTDAGRVALVATELATNLTRHAGQGQLLMQDMQVGGRTNVEIIALDSGPGMTDVAACLRDGFSSGGTPGTGLGAVRRLSDEFDVFAPSGGGCVVVARLRPRAPAGSATSRPAWRWGAVSVPAPGESVIGDSWRVQTSDGMLGVFVADGLGHGPLASEAAEEAARMFDASPYGPVPLFLQQAHRRLRTTRGAAVAAARSPAGSSTVSYAGVGNISGTVVGRDGTRRGLMSNNGTVGAAMREPRELSYEWQAGDRIIMHSDGITNRWNLGAYPGLLADRHPSVIGAVLYRDFVRGKDDATVVVIERAA